MCLSETQRPKLQPCSFPTLAEVTDPTDQPNKTNYNHKKSLKSLNQIISYIVYICLSARCTSLKNGFANIFVVANAIAGKYCLEYI